MIRSLYERFSDIGAYVIGRMIIVELWITWKSFFLENGLVMYIWVGSQIDPTFVQCLFGLQATSHIQAEKVKNQFCFFLV
jgi:hypothetical protein